MYKQGCTLLISTYNWPQALQLCLQSVLKQTILPNEIVIADDGSTNDTKTLIDEFRKTTTIAVKHVWHKDDGFRKTIILNEAIRNSNYAYIIQIDGDIIIHPKFIQEHLQQMEQGFFIRGSRILLDEKHTQQYIATQKTNLHFLSPGVQHRFNAIHSKLLSKIVFAISDKQSPNNVIGCNMSFFKKDFVAVNGYNNDITGWGREDGELAARLINSGILKKQVKNKAIAFHMFHGHFSRDRDEINMQILKQAIASKIKTCVNGYSTMHEAVVYL
jgi:glycosyltransferase involved in cell wall biosynthesis